MLNVTLKDFARSFGSVPDDFSHDCIKAIKEYDFRYKRLDKKSRDMVMLQVLRKLESDSQRIGAIERKDVWERGWSENLNEFINSGFNLDSLIPKFIRNDQPLRYCGDYIMPADTKFEYNFMTIFRIWLFQKYFHDFRTVYEFGCGTGLNLVLLAGLFPEKELHGSDFVESSVDLINIISGTYGWRMYGHSFDMINPDETYNIKGESAVLTFGSIEQLAGKYERFLQFLLVKKPGLCVHVEPTAELYDENKLFDYLALKFHQKRGYTEGLLPRLMELASQDRLEILKVKRLHFGSLYMEGYTYIVWRPI